MAGGRHQIDMCSGSLWDKILLFALPLMASSMLQLLFNAADVVVVGRFAGKEALAAVGSTSSLINLMINLFVGISVGTNVVVARNLGAGLYDNVRRSVHTSIAVALFSGFGLMVMGWFSVRQMLVWMSSPADIIDQSTLYLRIYFLGMPANLLYNFGAAILRAQGPLHLDWKQVRLELSMSRRILRVGLPAGIQSVLFPVQRGYPVGYQLF